MQTRTPLRLALLSLGASASLFAADVPAKLETRPVITLALAQKMANACMAHTRAANGAPLAIAIYDDGANLVLYLGMDGISAGTGPTAMAKGESAARFRATTATVAGWVQSNAAVGHVPGLLGVRGGLPIRTAAGKPLGGIGVSGAPSEVDEQCAQVALDAVAAELRGS
jgi:glc operon protein GlcG